MSLTKYTERTDVISQLSDQPALTSAQLKAKFDESGTKIKNYLNNTLTTEVEQLVATEKSALQTIINTLQTNITNYISDREKAIYHVGKIVIETENINPATYLGFGTWQYWGAGKVPVGVDFNDTDFNTSGMTGGEKTHTLTINEMPSHTHNINYGGVAKAPMVDTGIEDSQWGTKFRNEGGYRANAGEMQSTGGSQAHNNLQPYITCYMWKRIS
jgi:hypothetical protein